MAATRIYHWKHGWIPLDHAAAMSKAKGNEDAARRWIEDLGARGRYVLDVWSGN